MIHNAFGGSVGKMSDVYSEVEGTKALLYKIFHSVYEPFFSPEEVDKVLSGHDIWLDSDQVMGRIDKVCSGDNNKNEDNVKQGNGPTKTKRVGSKKRS